MPATADAQGGMEVLAQASAVVMQQEEIAAGILSDISSLSPLRRGTLVPTGASGAGEACRAPQPFPGACP